LALAPGLVAGCGPSRGLRAYGLPVARLHLLRGGSAGACRVLPDRVCRVLPRRRLSDRVAALQRVQPQPLPGAPAAAVPGQPPEHLLRRAANLRRFLRGGLLSGSAVPGRAPLREGQPLLFQARDLPELPQRGVLRRALPEPGPGELPAGGRSLRERALPPVLPQLSLPTPPRRLALLPGPGQLTSALPDELSKATPPRMTTMPRIWAAGRRSPKSSTAPRMGRSKVSDE